MNNPSDFEGELIQFFQDKQYEKIDTIGHPTPDYSKFWFPTSETCNDFCNLAPLQ